MGNTAEIPKILKSARTPYHNLTVLSTHPEGNMKSQPQIGPQVQLALLTWARTLTLKCSELLQYRAWLTCTGWKKGVQ